MESARPRPPRAVRELEIVSAATAVFTERGYAAGSMAEIAERVGVVEGTLYTYFESKRALLMRVVSDFYAELISDAESGLRAVRGCENRLRYLIVRHLRVYAQDADLCRVILSEIRPDPELYDDAVRALNRRYTSLTLGVIRDGIEAGELREDLSPPVFRDLIFGGMEHVLWRVLDAGEAIDAEIVDTLGEQLADVLLRGARVPIDEHDPVARLERAVASLERYSEQAR